MVSFIFKSLAILSLAATFVSGTPVPPDTTAPRINMRVWTHPRNPGFAWSHHAEIDQATNEVVVNKTAGYAGFNSYITDPTVEVGSPWRHGPMFADDSKDKAFLVPYTGSDTQSPPVAHTYYQLKFDKKIPKKVDGILSGNFTVLGRDCGGQCGGLALGYSTPTTPTYGGQYFIVRQSPGSNVWKLQWREDNVPAAADSTAVFVWVS